MPQLLGGWSLHVDSIFPWGVVSCLDTKQVKHFDQWELLSLVTFRPGSSALAVLRHYSPGPSGH